MLKYIIQQLKRSIVLNAAFCLLLALAGTLLSLGTGLLFTAVSSARQANDAFTTIAVPATPLIQRYARNYVNDGNMMEVLLWDGSVLTPGYMFNQKAMVMKERYILDDIADRIHDSGKFDMDTRRIFGGYSAGIVPHVLRPGVLGWADTHTLTIRSPNSTAAFIAVAENVRYDYVPAFDRELGYYFHEVKTITFAVEETLLIHPAYLHPPHLAAFFPPVETFELRLNARRADGTPMIEEGNRYFVFGRGFTQTQLFHPGDWMLEGDRLFGGYDRRSFDWLALERASVFYSFDEVPETSQGLFEDNVPAGGWIASRGYRTLLQWPVISYTRIFGDDHDPFNDPVLEFKRYNTGYRMLIELPDDPYAPLPDALQSEIDEILAMGSKSVNTMVVMTTNNLDSYFRFNQRRSRITEGRAFTREEIETGARVAVIHELTEGVEVGDIITLQLYETTVFNVYDITTVRFLWQITYPYNPVSLRTEPMEFEVIGKFNSLPVLLGAENEHFIPPNAIFIPDNSVAEFPFIVPEMTDTLRQSLYERGMSFDEWLTTCVGTLYSSWYDYERRRVPILNTIIIPNGENQAFLDAINEIMPEYAAFFRIYDQGFSAVSGALDNLMRNGTLILILCGAGWIIALLVFCLFYILRKRKEAGLLYALGINKKHRFRWLFVQCLIVVVLSQAIAFGAASALYEGTVNFAIDAAESAAEDQRAIFAETVIADDVEEIEFTIRSDPYAIPIAAAGQLAILLLISGGMSASIVGKGVVSLRRGVEG